MDKGVAASQQEEHGGELLWGSRAAQRAWGSATAGTKWPLPWACSADHDHEQGRRSFGTCEHARCTKNASVSYPPPQHTPCPSCLLARPSQCRNESLCQWAQGFSSCGCLIPRFPMTPTNLHKYRETAVAECEIGFSNIQCIPSTVVTNFLPKGFSLFSQKKNSQVSF